MFLGMMSLYFFMKYLQTLEKRYLFLVALFFSILFYTSYSSIPFIALSQILWLYKPREEAKKPTLSSFLTLNGLILIFCLPWIIFLITNYKGQTIMAPFHTESPGSFGYILYGVLHDWVPHTPLMIASTILFILFPVFSRYKMNALILLAAFVFPIWGLYQFCKLLNITHFVTSRYFINFLPLFLVALYLSLNAVEMKLGRLKRFLRLGPLFFILFIVSNLVILPLYYRTEKQDIRGLVTYLKGQLREGDKIFAGTTGYIPVILHYFGIHPRGRHHIAIYQKDSNGRVEYIDLFTYRNKTFTIHSSKACCTQYVADGSRLWIVVGKWTAKKIREESPCVLKGYFDGSFLNFDRFPTDASMYLFLWDPLSPEEKGIDMPIE